MKLAILSFLISTFLFSNCHASSDMTEFDWISNGYEAASKKNFPEAIKSYSKAIEKNAASSLAYYYRGLAYIESERYQDAVDDF